MKISELHTLTQYFLGLNTTHDFTMHDIQETMKNLVAILREHNFLYYVKAAPIIADSQYDQLFALLQHLEKLYPDYIVSDSPTQRLVGQISGFQKSSHRVPLLSLMNTYTSEDIASRAKTLVNSLSMRGDGDYDLRFSIEPKLDGNAVEIIYKDGMFLSASTRGDGMTGEDITQHAKYLLGLPLQLQGDIVPRLLSLRGEILMSKETHQRLNAEQLQEGLPLFANPRNAVAGTLRNLEPRIVQYRGLTVLFYDILYAEGLDIHNQTQMYEVLRTFGLPVIERIAVVDSIEGLQRICEDKKVLQDMEKQWYETDGLVIKTEEYVLRNIVGTTNHHPKWAMAYKFPSKQVVTKLLSVSYQIGRTGVITPVAELEPVVLGGVTVTRASLHNFEQIEKLDIYQGDSVWLQRSGEVIPYVIGPVIELRDGTQQKLEIPFVCPVCHEILVKDTSFVALRCVNDICPAIIKARLSHVVSKSCLDISGLGESVIELLVDAGLLQHIEDLFSLQDPYKSMQLRMLPGLADKKIKQILHAIESTKTLPCWRWLHALAIDGVGEKTARYLASWLASKQVCGAQQILSAFQQFDIQEHHGFGLSLATSLKSFASNGVVQQRMMLLEQLGVRFQPEQTQTHQGVLTGKYIVITGSFDLPRSQLITMIEELGGQVVSGVTKKIHAILVGAEPGEKAEQARKLGIPLFSNFGDLVNAFQNILK